MAVKYWVGDFFVDLSRNQITRKEHSQTIAPKALAVLTLLAENKGRVLSYDELFAKVWPDTVVTPNTLQRSIAQLRKVLDKDSKLQSYIKTHAKQGYSLECDIHWHDETASKTQTVPKPETNVEQVFDSVEAYRSQENEVAKADNDTTEKAQSPMAFLKLISVVFGVVALGVITIMTFTPKQTSQLSFDKLRSLTATDDKEYAAVYSPDSQHIVFHRYTNKVCMNHLWAKNKVTQQETRLTKDLGTYGSHSFSHDGNKLAFISTEDCDKPITQKSCYNLMTLDFKKALKRPQLSSLMVECKNSQLRDPVWIDNNNIAVLQKFSKRWKLTLYSINENKSTILFEVKEGNVIAFDYSVNEDLIAVTSVHSDGQYYIEMLTTHGKILSSHLIEFPQDFSKLRWISPNFDPLNSQLVFSSGRQFFTLSYQGKVSRVSIPLDYKIEQPSFHPDGTRLLLIKKRYDSDIASTPLHPTKTNGNYTVIERSTLGEDNAIFQPNGELIAFISERSGEDQLWITDGKGSQLISSFPNNTLIRGISWAANGKSILVNANGALTQVFLNKQQVKFSFNHPVIRLFQWNSENNTALLITSTKGVSKFVELNLDNSEFRVITDKKITWAQKSEDGRLIYTDRQRKFWQPGPTEDKLIEPLDSQGSSKRFVVNGDMIYGINRENSLWSYDLDNGNFELLRVLNENVDYLTDVNETHSLIELRISEKKEVVELTLNE
jgi:transcriptional activator of cad operon